MENPAVEVQHLADHLYCFQVPNLLGPSGQPTNVFVVGHEPVILIDAGSDNGGATVMAALEQLRISKVSTILLTHAHHDHAGSAAAVREATGAKVLLHQRELSGPSTTIVPDDYLIHGEMIDASPFRLQVLETPGHSPGHVSFYESQGKALFAGDLMSGFGSVAIVPPRGSMAEYLASLRRVRELPVTTVYPGHGPIIENGDVRIQEYIEHRERRETEILTLITDGVGAIEDLTELLYPDVLPRIRPLAAGTVTAHIVNLLERSRIQIDQAQPQLAGSRFVAVKVPPA